ncbi:MAG: lysophospholipid acyltransferase family protein [Pseudomonadota bacterium]
MSANAHLPQRISVRTVANRSTQLGRRLSTFAPVLDRLLGIQAIDRFCQDHRLYGLSPTTFADRALDALGVTIEGGDGLAQRVPREGPVIVASNHPHGGIEGLVLVRLLTALRPDVKIMANTALRVFSELAPLSIYVNPLAPGDPANRKGLRACLDHLNDGGLLLIFPAGRTSFYQPELGYIADSSWNTALGRLARRTDAQVLPMRFMGKNSRLFYGLGSLWYRFRLLMLARELMNKAGQTIELRAGQPIAARDLDRLDGAGLTHYLQVESAALAAPSCPGPAAVKEAPLAPGQSPTAIEREIAALPADQRLLKAHDCIVAYGRAAQLPTLVAQITRERERTYRIEDEGSGEPVDTDHFDDRVTHLFCWNTKAQALVGAYRIACRETLAADGGTYLSRVFAFDDTFIASRAPAIELGRSFVVPEFQRSRYALDLLWRGIGGYLKAHPRYELMYGTVSLTRRYDPVSIAMMCDVLIDAPEGVSARVPLANVLPPEWHQFRREHPLDLTTLNALIAAREPDGKGVPVLLRHYVALNARFHAVAVDETFAATPGLLLSVSLADLPATRRRRYLG